MAEQISEMDLLVLQWQVLTDYMKQNRYLQEEMARRRQEITRDLYAMPGMTHRLLGELLGCSGPTINNILHRQETKPGRKIREEEEI